METTDILDFMRDLWGIDDTGLPFTDYIKMTNSEYSRWIGYSEVPPNYSVKWALSTLKERLDNFPLDKLN